MYVCLSVCRPNVTQTVFANFQAAFLQKHVSILRNTTVYKDIKLP